MPFDLQKQNNLAGNLEYEDKYLTFFILILTNFMH